MEYLLILESTNRPLGGRRTNRETAFAAKASWYVRRGNGKKIRGREREFPFTESSSERRWKYDPNHKGEDASKP